MTATRPTKNRAKKKVLPVRYEEIVEKLPPEARQALIHANVTFSAWPTAELVEICEKFAPGATREILDLTKNNQESRIKISDAIIADTRRGTWLGFLAFLILLGAFFLTAVFFSEALAFGVLSIGFASVIGLFVKGRTLQ